MRKWKKLTLACLLSVVMVLALLPMATFAEDAGGPPSSDIGVPADGSGENQAAEGTGEAETQAPETTPGAAATATQPTGAATAEPAGEPMTETTSVAITDEPGGETTPVAVAGAQATLITGFNEYPYSNPDDPDTHYIVVDKGTAEDAIPLPMTLLATAEGGETDAYIVDVASWECAGTVDEYGGLAAGESYSADTPGTYRFAPTLALAEGVSLADGTEPPTVDVAVSANVAIKPLAVGNVSDETELRAAVASTGTGDVILSANIGDPTPLATGLIIERSLTLDLNGHSLMIELPRATGRDSNGIKLASNVMLTIMDSSIPSTGTLSVINNVARIDIDTYSNGNGTCINTTEGTLIIQSGAVNATTSGNGGAAIGGGYGGSAGGTITISGGTVNATSVGTTIGGGYGNSGGAGGTITISGGEVNATCRGGYGTAIGGGFGNSGGAGGAGGTITISGGEVNATCTLPRSTAIGGGYGGSGGAGGTITISGGEVNATINDDFGTAIGGGYGTGSGGAGGTITISGGTVNATSNVAYSTAIGGGYGANSGGAGGTITISGGTVNATSGGTTIGGGYGLIGTGGAGGSILIYGEDTVVTAQGSKNDIGPGAGPTMGTAGNLFVALPSANLTMSSTPLPSPNTVAFSATPASTGTVTATLPTPFDTMGTIDLLSNPGTTATNLSVITNFATENVSFALSGYSNSPITKTGTALKTSGAAVAFGITPASGDFTVGNLTQVAGSVTDVTVTPNSGKSQGAITLYYEGAAYPKSSTPPTVAGSYTVTFDVAADTANGYLAATGLAGGTLVVLPVFALTVTAGTGGSVNTAASGDYAAGDTIAVTATAGAGYHFVNWTSSGGGSFASATSASTTFTMPAGAATVTANFAALTISLSQTGTHTFTAAEYGYAAQAPLPVTVTNTGAAATGALTASLSGTNAGSFALSKTSVNSIAAGGTDAFTVAPNTGLAVGTYTATVTVSGAGGITASFAVSFTVGLAQQAALAVNGVGSAYTYGDAGFQVSVMGGSGTGAVAYASSDTSVASVSGDTVTILKAGSFHITATKAADGSYQAASADSAAATVSAAVPTVSVTGGNIAAYGAQATLSITVSGAGAVPAGTVGVYEGAALLGTATLVSGSASFTTTVAPAGGSHTYTVEYGGQAGYYSAATGTADIGVGLADQADLAITGLPPAVAYGDASFTLLTTGGSGTGAVTFSVPNSGVISITAAGTATINNAGTVVVTAAKAGDASHNPAYAVLTVAVSPRDISLVSVTVVGQTVYTGSQLQPNFSVTDGTLAIGTGDYTNAYGANTTVAQGGSVTLSGQRNYTGTKTVTFAISKATPAALTWPVASAITAGQALSASTLSGGSATGTWAWADGTIKPPAGSGSYDVVFTPNDTDNYDWTGVALTQAVAVVVLSAPAVSHRVIEHFEDFTGKDTSTARIDAEHGRFVRLLKDGVVIDPKHYTVTQGSTVITFNEAYLKTLANGTHWYVAEFSDGTSENIRLVVNASAATTPTPVPTPTNPGTGVPQTGDDSNMLGWWIALLVSALGAFGVIVWRRKRNANGTW